MFWPIRIEREYTRTPYGTFGLLGLYTACAIWFHGQGNDAIASLAFDPREPRIGALLTAQLCVHGPFWLVAVAIELWVFARYIEERLGPIRMCLVYFATGALVLAATIPMDLPTGPIGGVPGAFALTGMTWFTTPKATVRTAVWLPLLGLWKPRWLQIPVAAFVAFTALCTFLAGLYGDAPSVVELAGLGIGLIVTWLLRVPILRGTGWHLPREAHGGAIQRDSALDDADAMWRTLEAHQRRQRARDGEEAPQVYDIGVAPPRKPE